MSIALIGLPASGKTTVGRALAETCSMPFIDTDEMIERSAGRPISEIFADDGETAFREMEVEAARWALTGPDAVVSLGGGAIMSPAIRDMLTDHLVVWLDASVKTVSRRAGMTALRPLLLGDVRAQMEVLAASRRPIYEEVATARIDADTPSVDDQVAQIVDVVSATSPRTIHVNTAHPYDVVVSHGAVELLRTAVGSPTRVAVICPPVLASHVQKLPLPVRPLVVKVPEGEAAKTVDFLSQCWQDLADAGFTRDDVVIGFGGGATTDLAGFVAATYARGIAYVSVPTTVLGMADAAVGGKTGINLPEGKNLVGAFYEPQAVFADLDILKSLPQAETVSGLAEIIKCGFIADPRILDLVAADPNQCLDTQSWRFEAILRRAIEVKARVVSADLRETGAGGGVGREALNYGHTLAHAIEKAEGYSWAHGNAVAVGMVYAAEVACTLGLVEPDVVDTHRDLLRSVGLPTSYDGAPWDQIHATMTVDKKTRGLTLRLVLLDGIGSVLVVGGIEDHVLEEAYSHVHS